MIKTDMFSDLEDFATKHFPDASFPVILDKIRHRIPTRQMHRFLAQHDPEKTGTIQRQDLKKLFQAHDMVHHLNNDQMRTLLDRLHCQQQPSKVKYALLQKQPGQNIHVDLINRICTEMKCTKMKCTKMDISGGESYDVVMEFFRILAKLYNDLSEKGASIMPYVPGNLYLFILTVLKHFGRIRSPFFGHLMGQIIRNGVDVKASSFAKLPDNIRIRIMHVISQLILPIQDFRTINNMFIKTLQNTKGCSSDEKILLVDAVNRYLQQQLSSFGQFHVEGGFMGALVAFLDEDVHLCERFWKECVRFSAVHFARAVSFLSDANRKLFLKYFMMYNTNLQAIVNLSDTTLGVDIFNDLVDIVFGWKKTTPPLTKKDLERLVFNMAIVYRERFREEQPLVQIGVTMPPTRYSRASSRASIPPLQRIPQQRTSQTISDLSGGSSSAGSSSAGGSSSGRSSAGGSSSAGGPIKDPVHYLDRLMFQQDGGISPFVRARFRQGDAMTVFGTQKRDITRAVFSIKDPKKRMEYIQKIRTFQEDLSEHLRHV